MPWKEVTTMMARKEFVLLAEDRQLSFSELCRRHGISRKTGYKWLSRFKASGAEGLSDHSRRPQQSPIKTSAEMEQAILDVRHKHSAWGGRKIRRHLQNKGNPSVPSASTVTEVLRRNGQLNEDDSLKHQPYQRFERPEPNSLWQMDFKGHVPFLDGRCHPLTVLDDCSRYAIALRACVNENTTTVRDALMAAFRQYGLPWQMLMDNGSPWGSTTEHAYTPLVVWLMRLGVEVSHGRPYHPQTQGKEERFHRTLKAELVGTHLPWHMEECQQQFDQWRMMYNWVRPHEALDMDIPGHRYYPSSRTFQEKLPEVEYGPDDIVRKVQQGGYVSWRGHEFKVPKAFRGNPVAIRPQTVNDDFMDIYFCRQKIAQINLRSYG